MKIHYTKALPKFINSNQKINSIKYCKKTFINDDFFLSGLPGNKLVCGD